MVPKDNIVMSELPPLKKILVPTDLSDLSAHALEWADRIADRSEAEIHALKILEPPGEMLFDPEGDLLEVEEYDMGQLDLERKSDEEGVQKWAANARNPVIKSVQIGRLVEDTLRYVQENGIELIVMGTHGTQGAWEWLAGSVAEKMVRYSNAPVLSIKSDPQGRSIDRLLLASDLETPELWERDGDAEKSGCVSKGKNNKEPIAVVKKLRELFGAELHLLRVLEEKEAGDKELWENAMDRFIERNELGAAKKHIEVNDDVEDGILTFAQRENMGLIAIGSHGHHGWGHLFHHSVSEDVVDHLHVPVLTYRIDGNK